MQTTLSTTRLEFIFVVLPKPLCIMAVGYTVLSCTFVVLCVR